jgi:transcriptional regulator with XRE-family HTH domain
MPHNLQKELNKLGIGSKIKNLRKQKKISPSELAQKLKITTVLLSQIEESVVTPTIGTLLNMARVFGVGIDYFFTQKETVDQVELTRKNDRLEVPSRRKSDSNRLTYKYQALSYRLQGKKMEPFLVEFNTKVDEDVVPLSHNGEEFIYCLEGEIEYVSEEQNIVLKPGDSLYYYSSVPHILRGIGSVKPKAIAVLLP